MNEDQQKKELATVSKSKTMLLFNFDLEALLLIVYWFNILINKHIDKITGDDPFGFRLLATDAWLWVILLFILGCYIFASQFGVVVLKMIAASDRSVLIMYLSYINCFMWLMHFTFYHLEKYQKESILPSMIIFTIVMVIDGIVFYFNQQDKLKFSQIEDKK